MDAPIYEEIRRIQQAERRLYPEVVGALAEGRIEVKGRLCAWRK